MKYKTFIFEDYRYVDSSSTLTLIYRFDRGQRFEEKLIFDFAQRELSQAESDVLDRIFRLVFLMAGVSYYKAFVPETLICEAFPLDRATAGLIQNLYEKGLAEFAFTNGICLRNHLEVRSTAAPSVSPIAVELPQRACVPVGGGKDSIVSIECLKHAGEPLTLFALGEAEPISACITTAQLPFIRVRRRLDPELFRLNRAGAFNGHIPITGILSAIAMAAAVMHGADAVVMSNEHSASAPNLRLGDIEVNHQFSKSFEFEIELANFVQTYISPSIKYFSLLRPLSEIEIARRFARYPQYFGIFHSCNAAFRQARDARATEWCGSCPKCRFVFLALSPFLAKADLIRIFRRNLLDDDNQRHGFATLCGIQAHKPFECVGEVGESAAVMSYLGSRPEWRTDTVVRQLHNDFPELRQQDPGAYRSLFENKQPHRVPQKYLAMLDASR
jgi:UDP-N-acetyl-alpha-D-muramoyl-L-alanyl-L-glutamate epimerase